MALSFNVNNGSARGINPRTLDGSVTFDNTGIASQPTAFDPNSVGTGGTSGSAGSGVSAALTSANQQAINNIHSAIDRLASQQNVGYQNVDTAYNDALNQENQAKANNELAYNGSKNQTTQDYVTAKNTIGTNAGSSINSLQRLLGARGAGGSSAALFNAPQAVVQQASQQRAGAGQTFGGNNQQLDSNWNNYLQGYNNDLTNLDRQKTNNRNSVDAQVSTTRAGLLQSLAQLMSSPQAAQPYIDQANTALGQADQFGLQAPVNQVAPTAYQAPSLDSYSVNPFATPQSGGATSAADNISPYLSLLLGKNKNLQPQF